jgi:hypothetical protein
VDAVQIAAALDAEAEAFLTNDKKLSGIKEIKIIGSSLKCMGKAVCNMIEIRDQEIEEVDTDRHERHGSFSVGFGFETAMVCGIV